MQMAGSGGARDPTFELILMAGLRRWLGGRHHGCEVSSRRDGRGARARSDSLGEQREVCQCQAARQLTRQEMLPKDRADFGISLKEHLPPDAKPDSDRLIDVRPVNVLITWHALNQMASSATPGARWD